MSIFDPDTIFNVPTDTAQLVGRNPDIRMLLRQLKGLRVPGIQLVGEHGVGKSTLLRRIGHVLHTKRRGLQIVYVDCRPSVHSGGGEVKSREGLVRDLAAASGGLQGLDASDREPALLRRLHNGRWVVLLDGFESTIGGEGEDFARQIGLNGTATLVISTTTQVRWIDVIHMLAPLRLPDAIALVRRGAESVHTSSAPSARVSEADIIAAAGASRGLPDLALRAGRLLQSGVAIGAAIESIEQDRVSYYRLELEQLSKSELHNRVVSIGLVIAVPMAADRTAAMLGIRSGDCARALMQLRDQGLLDFYDGRYRPRDLLVNALGAARLDLTVLDGFLRWLAAYLPDQRDFTWSRSDIKRCDEVADYIRAFLRLDEMAARKGFFSVEEYARIAADLGGWLFAEGYWLELDRLVERIDATLWNAGRARPLIKVHLLWRLKSLLKRKLHSEAWLSLVHLLERLPSIPTGEQELLSLSVTVCAPQMRNAPTDGVLVRALVGNPGLVALWPEPESVVHAERRLEQLGEVELVCISMNRRGNVEAELGALTEAERLYRRVEELSLVANSGWSVDTRAIARGNLGVVCNRGQRWTAALDFLRDAEDMVAQESERAVVFAELSRAHSALGDNRSAVKYWAEAKRIADALALDRPRCESDPGWTLEAKFSTWRIW